MPSADQVALMLPLARATIPGPELTICAAWRPLRWTSEPGAAGVGRQRRARDATKAGSLRVRSELVGARVGTWKSSGRPGCRSRLAADRRAFTGR